MKSESRTFEQIKEHYDLERMLADRLRSADREERQHLYTALYDQLFESLPHHPQITRKSDPQASQTEVMRKMRLLRPYLNPQTTFLEVGPGDCKFSFAVAQQVKQVYAIDISNEITKNPDSPHNCELVICDGCNIPLCEKLIDVAYSNQLMEHLHPEDAIAQLQDIYRLLKPGGVYICITPNRLYGPSDVSQYFGDDEATGFHLKEYTHTELCNLFAEVGFSKVLAYAGGKGWYMRFPSGLIKFTETLLSQLPSPLRKSIARFLPVKAILGTITISVK
jgi:SAM-dependent methyltransferase